MKNVPRNTLSRGEGATKWRVRNSGRTIKFQPSTDFELLTRIPHPVSLRSPTFPPGEGMRCALFADTLNSNLQQKEGAAGPAAPLGILQ